MIHKDLQSQTIATLRFPLIVGVVLIHAHMTDIIIGGKNVFSQLDFPIYSFVATLLSEVLARIAVPLFFILSGFLFFYHTTFNRMVYAAKLRKRARSILLPYLIWNLIVIWLFFLAQNLLPSLMSGVNKPIIDYTLKEWIEAFWAKQSADPSSGNMPINYPLWFIRDLMVVMLLSPIIYLLVKHLKFIGVMLLGTLWLSGISSGIPGLSTTALFFFSVGAVFSVHNLNMVESLYPLRKAATISYVALVICDLLTLNMIGHSYIHNLGIIAGCTCMITLTAWGLQKGMWHIKDWLAGCSFFIFAFHGMPLALIIKVCIKFIPIHHEAIAIAIYLGSTILVIVLAIMLYLFMRRYLPRLLAILTGGR